MTKEYDEKSKNLKIKNYTFDYMVQLYKKDPEKFNELHEEIINDHINSIQDPYKKFKMQAFQSSISNMLNGIKDPKARFLKIQELFYKGLYEFRDAIKIGLYDNNGNITINTVLDVVKDEKNKEQTKEMKDTTKTNVVQMFKK